MIENEKIMSQIIQQRILIKIYNLNLADLNYYNWSYNCKCISCHAWIVSKQAFEYRLREL